MKFILHNWDDEDCVRLLSNVYEVAPRDARVFVIGTVVPGPGTSHVSKQLDVPMMVHAGGRERTEPEYARLLEPAEWTLEDIWEPEDGALTVLEATKA